ncbi:MAG TPA: hypothetical protein VFZ09_46985 [Archangium sp.]|nr:hypothetical protein [Archangium sp.]HEX5753821.1 hypothetical protein [Archangium sp.]
MFWGDYLESSSTGQLDASQRAPGLHQGLDTFLEGAPWLAGRGP